LTTSAYLSRLQDKFIFLILSHQLRIDILDDKEQEQPVSVHPYILGTPFDSSLNLTLPYPPLLLVPRVKLDYFAQPESFSVLAMLRNPLVLMMVVMLPMSFAMPYLMVS
jgi:ER membrane protein complex subunit 7